MKCGWAFLALLLLAPIANSDFAGSRAYFINSELYSTIVLNSFTMPSDQVTAGSSTDFSVTFENTGTASTTATARVYIFNAASVLVDTVNYSAISIVPNQQITQQKAWSTGMLPVGAYTARANVTYDPGDGSTAVSNELSLSFAIVGGGGTGGGGGGLQPDTEQKLKPIQFVPLPPLVPKMGGPVDFTKVPVLKEMIAGQSAVQNVEFENRRAEAQVVKLSAAGVDADWLRVSTPGEITMMPGEKRKIDLAISVPENAMEGDYLVKLDATGASAQDVSTDFMILRVKGVSPARTQPILLRTIEVDRIGKKTFVSISVRNPSAKDMKRTLLFDTLPTEMDKDRVEFLDKPGEVLTLEGKKYLSWEFPELLSHEQVGVSYALSGVLTEYSPYVNDYNSELVVTKKVDLSNVVQIMDLSASAMKRGEAGQVVATVLYMGEEPLPVTLTLEAPAGFIVDPSYLSVVLLPRNTFTARFDVTPPEDAVESQLVRFVLFTDDGQVSARLPIVMTSEAAAPPAASQLAISVRPGDVALAGVMAIMLIFGYLFLRRRGEGRGGAQFSEERLEYAKSLRKLVKTEID
ncbi:MAG: hypothetical protein Q7T16_06320 [Candidatus Burarchaeum sp.]|nr:hypothetical protein [Candidatus Burarchaeum sp.]MDO8340243.1 hypothetical protein [Candidatus Burarchaeum sp.]